MRKVGPDMNNSQSFITMIDSTNNSTAGKLSSVFFTVKYGANSLAYSVTAKGWFNLVIFLIMNIAAFIVICVLAQGLYFKGAVGIAESSSKRKKLSKDEFGKTYSRKLCT